MTSERLYFAYGSNINLDQMERRCPNAKVIAPVTLENYRLAFRASGVATILPEEGSTVHGLLWDLTPVCEASLDHYEGFPRFYDKQDVAVRDADGNRLSAMAYIMDPEYSRISAMPIPDYCDGIRNGFLQNGLPVAVFNQAVNRGIAEARQVSRDPWQSFGRKLQEKQKPHKKHRER